MRDAAVGKLFAMAMGLVCSVLAVSQLSADVKLPKLLGRHMVLQRNKPVKIWGTADAGEKVSVDFHGQKLDTTADAKGDWHVTLKPMKAGGPFKMTIKANNTITLKDILVGDVWVCSGQSNMAFPLWESMNAKKVLKTDNYPNLRFFRVKTYSAETPQKGLRGWSWKTAETGHARVFSAVAYFFGRYLRKKLNIPIGLISSDWGGTRAQPWIPAKAFAQVPAFKGIRDHWKKLIAAYPADYAKYKKAYAQWLDAVKKAKEGGKSPKGHRPWPPMGPQSHRRPGNLYNSMIAPVTRFPITGVIWYQGESDTFHAALYRKLLPTLIGSWRAAWGQPDLPFIVVQLANFKKPPKTPQRSDWAMLGEAQAMTAEADPNVGLAVAIDIGEANNIHPGNKQAVGKRLALWALANVYKKHIVWSGPTFESMKIKGDKVCVTFKHIGSGLKARTSAKPNRTSYQTIPNYKFTLGDGPVTGFALAGADKVFYWAKAKIAGDTVILWSEKVAKPVAVRYAWANNPDCNLYNAEGLPAVPFRTDKWDDK